MGARRFLFGVVVSGLLFGWGQGVLFAQGADDLIFIHHSVGDNWLNDGLRDALLAKDYIDEVNEITYGTDVAPDAGRPDSLQELDPGAVPGDHTNINHWIFWFNDYLESVRRHDCETGANRIVMFKSCYPTSDVFEDGAEPGDPFVEDQILTNYRAVYRHRDGSGRTYTRDAHAYRALADVFAANPDVLFIVVTSPSRIPSETCNDWADRGRVFAGWLKNNWLNQYNAAHPALQNVAVFDLFDMLAHPAGFAGTETYTPADGGPEGAYPVRNMTQPKYRTDDSHPNGTAGQDATALFATNVSNFLDPAHAAWRSAQPDTGVPSRRWNLYR